jgi:hypothetical protein
MRRFRWLLLLAGCLWLPAITGCSTTGIAVGAMGPILENTKVAALASSDIRTFDAAVPSNLMLLEGLIQTDPKKANLRITAAMMYFSYAFTFDSPADEGYASTLYLKGFEHAKAALLRNKAMAAAWDKPVDDFVAATAELTDKDLEAIMWTAANWSQFISLHLDSTKVLTQIPRNTALMERAAEIDGTYFEGLPYIMLGSLHAFRPQLMGGDPVAALANFEKAFAVSDSRFLLAHYLYAKFYCHRILDDVQFEEKLQYVLDQPDDILPEYRLLNAIARQKSAILLKEKDELF